MSDDKMLVQMTRAELRALIDEAVDRAVAAVRDSPDRAMLTTRDVAKLMRVHERTIINWIKSGTLAATRVGSRWRIHPDVLDAFTRPDAA
ncbi:MAG: helix-turn-helix domain-containing protein [Myxococcota bacterium]